MNQQKKVTFSVIFILVGLFFILLIDAIACDSTVFGNDSYQDTPEKALAKAAEVPLYTEILTPKIMLDTIYLEDGAEMFFVAENDSFVLPERTVAGEMFIGWEYNGKVYPAGYTISNIHADAVITAVTLDMDMRVGASVRISNDYENSIRWTADVNKNSLSVLSGSVFCAKKDSRFIRLPQ